MSTEAQGEYTGMEVAIVGMAGRFPGAEELEAFWRKVRDGVECISFATDDELLAAGVPADMLTHPDLVRGAGVLGDVAGFDAPFFGYSPREAELMEPGHRLFLEVAWEALENAGYDPGRADFPVGVYAGAGASYYVETHVRANPELAAAAGEFQLSIGSGKDFLATRTSYKLNLRGPSVSVQTACSTSLVAVHLAAQALLHGECDMVLAGGVSVVVPQNTGYLYQHGGVMSPDGHCRAFDAKAQGAQGGSGLGVVVLKRLADALRDGDHVRAVIKGSAVNNDGAVKVAYTAPSVEGQAAVITEALTVADVDPDTIGYVEAHGTGTELGDPIEIAALTRAYRAFTDRRQFCVVGAVKTNIGHLDTAAGVAGLVKTVLALEHGELPPTVHFTEPNPKIDFAGSPFHVLGEAREWKTDGAPRRAGVSSFGIGGTNAHVVLEEAPAADPTITRRPWQLLTVSARSGAALDEATRRLAAHLREHPEQHLADVAWTLQAGRREFAHRRVVVARDGDEAAALLEARHPDRAPAAAVEGGHRSVAFMFPGLGDHYVQMGRGLYETEPVFRAEVDRCAELLLPQIGSDVRQVLFPGDAPAEPSFAETSGGGFDLRRMLGREPAAPDPAAERLNRTELAQPALFVVEYALAKLWMAWGVRPEAVIGHSLGEYAAACIAGVFTLEDALSLVAARARLIQELPGGGMLAIPLSPEAVRPFLASGAAVATVNAPALCVVAGPDDAVEATSAALAAAGHAARRLPTTHAFHSPMMDPVVEPLAALVSRMKLRAPEIPFLSNVTGTWLTVEEATDPRHWARHLRETVQFDRGVAELLREPGRVLVEVGPGQTLGTFVRQRPSSDGISQPPVVASLRHAYDRQADGAFFLGALGRLWLAGVAADWRAVHDGERLHRVPLPTYPWERQRYWVERPVAESVLPAISGGRLPEPARWLYVSSWKRAPSAPPVAKGEERWVVLAGGDALSEAVVASLRATGRIVTEVRPGGRFAAAGEDAYHVRPDAPDDWRDLLAALGGAPAGVLHLWSLGSEGASQARGFVTLAYLADALERAGAELPLVSVADGVFEVTGDEALAPEKAPLLGALRVLGQEHPALKCRLVDVSPEGADAFALAGRVLAEALGGGEAQVALRGRHRWVRTWEPAAPRGDGRARIRQGGTYLLTGGLRGRNALLARHLAAEHGARLVLVDHVLPSRSAWEQTVAIRDADNPIRRMIEAVWALEAAGTEVLALHAWASQADQVEDAFRKAEERFGRVDGVLHAPTLDEMSDFGLAAEVKPADWDRQLGAVAAELSALEAALASRSPDFVLVESSLTPVLGGVGVSRVAAADALVDAFVARRAQSGGAPWTAVGWDRWYAPDEEPSGYGMDEREALAAFGHVLSLAGEAQVLVSTGDPAARAAEAARATSTVAASGGYARPELDTEYFAPTNELEEQIAEMWQGLLGIDRIGIHDDFFGLGGHSLLATQIISRVREMFQLELPLKAIFEAPTVARFAALVEAAIIAEIDALTDEEALKLV